MCVDDNCKFYVESCRKLFGELNLMKIISSLTIRTWFLIEIRLKWQEKVAKIIENCNYSSNNNWKAPSFWMIVQEYLEDSASNAVSYAWFGWVEASEQVLWKWSSSGEGALKDLKLEKCVSMIIVSFMSNLAENCLDI